MIFEKLMLFIGCFHLTYCRTLRATDQKVHQELHEDYFYDPEYLASSEYIYYDSEYDEILENDLKSKDDNDNDLEYNADNDLNYMQETSTRSMVRKQTDIQEDLFDLKAKEDVYEYLEDEQESYTYDDDYEYGDEYDVEYLSEEPYYLFSEKKTKNQPVYDKRRDKPLEYKQSVKSLKVDNYDPSNIGGYKNLKEHILDLISIYKKQVQNTAKDFDYDDYDTFYNFENYYEFDPDNLETTKENVNVPKSVFYEYIDIGDHLNFKKQWNGVTGSRWNQ